MQWKLLFRKQTTGYCSEYRQQECQDCLNSAQEDEYIVSIKLVFCAISFHTLHSSSNCKTNTVWSWHFSLCTSGWLLHQITQQVHVCVLLGQFHLSDGVSQAMVLLDWQCWSCLGLLVTVTSTVCAFERQVITTVVKTKLYTGSALGCNKGKPGPVAWLFHCNVAVKW